MSGMNWKLEDDYQTVTLTLPTDPPMQLKMNLEVVEDVLKNLGDFRGAMKPEVVAQFPMGQRVEAIPDPAWVTEPDFLTGDSLIHIRDPRYGWLHYLLPRNEARHLAETLETQAGAPPPGPPQDKPS